MILNNPTYFRKYSVTNLISINYSVCFQTKHIIYDISQNATKYMYIEFNCRLDQQWLG